MTRVQMTVRALMLALAGVMTMAGAAAAHNGEDHGGGSTGVPLWLGMVMVGAFLAVIYPTVRRRDPDLTVMEFEEREEVNDR